MLGKYATARFGIIMGMVVALCLVVALVCVFVLQPTEQSRNTTLDQGGQEFVEVEDSYNEPSKDATPNPYQPSGVNQGTVYWDQIENGYYELTAVPHRAEPNDSDLTSFVFAYWVCTMNGKQTKISGDETIRVKTYTTANAVTAREYIPVFIQETNNVGTATDYVHYVTNLQSLNDTYMSQNGAAGHIFILQNDITLTNFTPIGYSSTTAYTPFAGVLDGNGHTIESLTIQNGGQYVGIFCGLNGGVIKDLSIRSGTITCSNTNGSVGAFAGVMVNSLISRCVNHAAVIATGTGGVAAGFVGTVNLTEVTLAGALTSSLYKNENYGAIRGNSVGAIVFTNQTYLDSNTREETPAAYLIQNINQGSFQTNTATPA